MTMTIPDLPLAWPIPVEAVLLIAEREQGPRGGVALKAYRCPAGVWTIGLGETEIHGRAVRPGDTCLESEAWQFLCTDLTTRTAAVKALCTREPSPSELGAMVSLAYNIGLGALAQSTVLRAHNRGDAAAAAQAFTLWDKARVNGVLTELPGLKARRHAEAALYLLDATSVTTTMPQTVAAQPSLMLSPTAVTNAAGTVASGLGVAAWALKEAGFETPMDALQQMPALAQQYGVGPSPALFGVALVVFGVLLYRRLKQRADGKA